MHFAAHGAFVWHNQILARELLVRKVLWFLSVRLRLFIEAVSLAHGFLLGLGRIIGAQGLFFELDGALEVAGFSVSGGECV